MGCFSFFYKNNFRCNRLSNKILKAKFTRITIFFTEKFFENVLEFCA